MTISTNTPPNIQELSKKAEEIYNALSEELKSQNEGKYIAIEIDSGEYFIGETREEAVLKAKKEHPQKVVFIRRVGNIEKISLHSSSIFINNSYGRLL